MIILLLHIRFSDMLSSLTSLLTFLKAYIKYKAKERHPSSPLATLRHGPSSPLASGYAFQATPRQDAETGKGTEAEGKNKIDRIP